MELGYHHNQIVEQSFLFLNYLTMEAYSLYHKRKIFQNLIEFLLSQKLIVHSLEIQSDQKDLHVIVIVF